MYVIREVVNVKGCASASKPPYIALDTKEALRSGCGTTAAPRHGSRQMATVG
jgi:hypothetical protein